MNVVKRLRIFKLNDVQVKAIADLLLEIGKWLLLAVVLSSFFIDNQGISDRSRVIGLIFAFIVISVAIWMLKRR